MSGITIRDLDESVTKRLRLRAQEHGRSVEDEAHNILTNLLAEPPATANLYDAIRGDVEALGGVELEPLPRHRIRALPDFSGPEFAAYDDE
jgi:plasmid stability protein